MAGRPKRIRSIQSYVNHIDNNTFSGPMKMGTPPSIGKTRNNKSITQYDLEGNFIKDWPSRTEAKKWLGVGDIAGCLAGKQKQAGGFVWKYKK